MEMFVSYAAAGSDHDVVAEDSLTQLSADRGSYVGCIAGALSRAEYLEGLSTAGFVDAVVRFTHEMPTACCVIIRATKPHQSPKPAPAGVDFE